MNNEKTVMDAAACGQDTDAAACGQDTDAAERGQSAEPKPGLVGIRCNDTSGLCWSLAHGVEIVCQARKIGERAWSIEGRSKGELRIAATVIGGKWQALRYMSFIRNGMVSRAMRRKHRGAAETETPGRNE